MNLELSRPDTYIINCAESFELQQSIPVSDDEEEDRSVDADSNLTDDDLPNAYNTNIEVKTPHDHHFFVTNCITEHAETRPSVEFDHSLETDDDDGEEQDITESASYEISPLSALPSCSRQKEDRKSDSVSSEEQDTVETGDQSHTPTRPQFEAGAHADVNNSVDHSVEHSWSPSELSVDLEPFTEPNPAVPGPKSPHSEHNPDHASTPQ
ncbi:unnamed protein product [Echinostoma caproni]|uniref:Osteopontin n=1 Tax=Echinostoma caproni TaxID=27848 RepID=A0A183B6Q0_9TREM|nr:unnamed protein product [Echinostoma caproni]